MKNKDFKLQKLDKQLKAKKREGKTSVKWKLSRPELKYLSQWYIIEPYLYGIRTISFSNTRNLKSPLLKEIHFAHKEGRREINKALCEKELALLHDMGIYTRIVRYKIFL